MKVDFSPLVAALAKSKQDSRDQERLEMERKRHNAEMTRYKAEFGEAQIEPDAPKAPAVKTQKPGQWRAEFGEAQIHPEQKWDVQFGDAKIERPAHPSLERPQLQGELNNLGDQGGMRRPTSAPPAPQSLPPGTPTYGSPYAPQQETLSVEDKLRSLGYY